MVCGAATGVHAARNGMLSSGVQIDCARLRITLGTPVDPLLQIPLTVGDTAAGSASADCPAAHDASAETWCSSTSTAGSITASTRERSHFGRSQRIGTGTAPIFQQPNAARTNA